MRFSPPVSGLSYRVTFLILLALSVLPAAVAADDVVSRVTSGGVGRFRVGHWGLVKGFFSNKSDQDQTVTAIVTPHGRQNAQYIRSIVVPSHTNRDSVWPVLLDDSDPKVFEFDVVLLKGTDDSRQITQLRGGEFTDNFASGNPRGYTQPQPSLTLPPGYCGFLTTRTEASDELDDVTDLMGALRAQAGLTAMTVPLRPEDIRIYAEGLEPLDQLIVTSPDLADHPETCDAVRSWIQRGGRALLMLDQCGEETASALLGEALPLSVVDRTSPLTLPLKQQMETESPGQPNLSHLREFDEPVTLVRTIFEAGTVLWSVRGWPALVEVPFGNGQVFVATVSARVFLSEQSRDELDAISGNILEQMFKTRPEAPLLSQKQLSAAAEQRIGYVIPSRQFAAIVLSVFTVVLGLVSWLAWKRDRPGLLLAIPIVSLIAAVPGMVKGVASRQVAPATLIQNRVAFLTRGQTTLAADGVSTVYQPSGGSADLLLPESSLVFAPPESTSPQSQRLVWTEAGDSRWAGFSQPAGATSYLQRSMVNLPTPLRAVVAFGAEDVEISLTNAELLNPEDPIIASASPDRMAVRSVEQGIFAGGPADTLASEELSRETLLSETQVLHADLYRQIFSSEARLSRFPAEPTLMFWTDKLPSSVQLTDNSVRTESMSLISLPLEFEIPAVDEPLTIPTALMPYRAVQDTDGSFSSAFSNRQARWIQRKAGSNTLLKFELPRVCQPFHFDEAEVQLRILAGSRTVRIYSGDPSDMVEVETLESPVGNHPISIPGSLLNAGSDGSGVFLRISVGELAGVVPGGEMNAEQDDFWKIDRVLMTVRGHRRSLLSSSEENTAADE